MNLKVMKLVSKLAASNPVLEVVAAHRAFAERQALSDVHLKASGGEIIALLGPNGAGKTSLMRAIAGRLKLDKGSVTVVGSDPQVVSAAREKLGIVPQTIALYPSLTARQNLDVFARLAGLKSAAIQKSVKLALSRAQLEDRANDQLSELSGGM
ncbi:MAG: ABC transporter ATP-binding protein, partial [Gammaproteobacteria bacterium]|nr:ABC transporter ATP-binding protein [Gammaproteobacteria bacterium]